MWPNTELLNLINIKIPIVQAPMAGANDSNMAISVANAGGLGSIPCGMLDLNEMKEEILNFRQHSSQPLNVNFFCHETLPETPQTEAVWANTLQPFYDELGVDSQQECVHVARVSFDDERCRLVEELRPEIVSFHFGLPSTFLLNRVKATGACIMATATTVEEARYLENHCCDVVIAQGYESGGHRGMFLTTDVESQVGLFALLPQIVDAVSIPVIAAGGIADARGIAAAFMLGAAGVQLGSAYMLSPESIISDLHRDNIQKHSVDNTAVTNVFSGRPARGIINKLMKDLGPISNLSPAFPKAGDALSLLKIEAEKCGNSDFSSLWVGQAGSMAQEKSSAEITKTLAREARKLLKLSSGINGKFQEAKL